jgi:hypothetical protein
MKMVAEYLDKALLFEQMASTENDPNLKEQLVKQAEAYRNWQLNAPRKKACRIRLRHHQTDYRRNKE